MTHVLDSIHQVMLYTRDLLPFTDLPPTLQPCQVVWLRTLELQVQFQIRGVLACSTVLRFQAVLCATVVSPLGPLLFIAVTLPIILRNLGSENARVVKTLKIVETGVVLFHNVLLVSYFILALKVYCLVYVGYNKIYTKPPTLSPTHLRKR